MSKRFILFIVEGINDEKEIAAILGSSYFDKYRDKYVPYIYPVHEDITSSVKITDKNIQKKLNDILQDFRRKGVPFSNIRISDIQEIVQITDLDGCFVPDENVIRSDDPTFIYTDEAIITSNVAGACGRNKKKTGILFKLLDVKQIANIPYSIYYVSCNMEHLLFDIRTVSKDKKRELADGFQEKCKDDPTYLEQSVFKKGICSNCSYDESWDEMLRECESLKRHTNFNLFFSDNAKNKK